MNRARNGLHLRGRVAALFDAATKLLVVEFVWSSGHGWADASRVTADETSHHARAAAVTLTSRQLCSASPRPRRCAPMPPAGGTSDLRRVESPSVCAAYCAARRTHFPDKAAVSSRTNGLLRTVA